MVKISKEFGLNPSVLQCPCCGKEFAVALFGTGFKDKNGKTAQAPMKVAIPNQLCNECLDIIKNKNGVFFIEVKEGEGKIHPNNPYRTGRLLAIPRDKAEEMFNGVSHINYMEEPMFEQVFGDAVREHKEQETQQENQQQ